MALTRVAAAGINTGQTFVLQNVNTSGIVTAGTVQVGSATTIHSGGIDLGSGNITSHNINSTGIITATGGFVGAVTGNVTGNLTGNVTGNVTGNLTGDVTGDLTGNVTGNVTGNLTGTATTASSLSGTPNVIVGVLTATDAVINGNLTVQGTTTTLDTTLTEVDKLEVGANNATVGVAITQSGAGDILRLYDSSTQVVTVADGGKVGIGTDIPATKLNVIGDARIEGFSNAKIQIKRTGNTVANGSIEFIGSDNSFGWGLIANYDAGGSNFNIKEGSNSRLYIKSGNVGINSTSPTAKLDVVGNTQVTGDSQVTGNARVTGILTVGQNSTTINGAHEYPSIRPTLDLNFAATKTLDRRITFTRDSLGTYTDELGVLKYASNNTPRFDHDPATGESLGLLIEESRTNLVPDSTTYNGWTTYSSSIPSTTQETLAPDGTYTAIKIISTGTQSQFGFREELTYSANTVYTHSMWLKAGTATRVGLTISSGSRWTTLPYLLVDLDTGTVVNTGNSISTKLTAYPNGWYLLEATGEFGGTSQTDGIWSYTATTGGHSGDTTSYYYQWGGQIEQGSFATSYIPTSGSTVTRAVDTAVIKGTNFSSWYNASESTIFFESGIAPTNNSKYFTFYGSDGGGTELIESAAVSGPGANIFTYADSTVYSNTSVTDASATKLKFAAGIKLNDVNLAVNGILGTTDTSATNPDAINQLIIGNYSSGSYYANTTIKKLSYYNKRLPNAQLQGLTAQ